MKILQFAEMLAGCFVLIGCATWESLQPQPGQHAHRDTFDAR